jgi:hypothetical protein
MRVSDVRKRYPEFFVTVEEAVWDDMGDAFRKTCRPDDKVLQRVCYKAAAVATLELHKIASRKKIIVAGKTSANTQSAAIAQIAAAMEREIVTVKNGSAPMNLSVVSRWARQLRAL